MSSWTGKLFLKLELSAPNAAWEYSAMCPRLHAFVLLDNSCRKGNSKLQYTFFSLMLSPSVVCTSVFLQAARSFDRLLQPNFESNNLLSNHQHSTSHPSSRDMDCTSPSTTNADHKVDTNLWAYSQLADIELVNIYAMEAFLICTIFVWDRMICADKWLGNRLRCKRRILTLWLTHQGRIQSQKTDCKSGQYHNCKLKSRLLAHIEV